MRGEYLYISSWSKSYLLISPVFDCKLFVTGLALLLFTFLSLAFYETIAFPQGERTPAAQSDNGISNKQSNFYTPDAKSFQNDPDFNGIPYMELTDESPEQDKKIINEIITKVGTSIVAIDGNVYISILYAK